MCPTLGLDRLDGVGAWPATPASAAVPSPSAEGRSGACVPAGAPDGCRRSAACARVPAPRPRPMGRPSVGRSGSSGRSSLPAAPFAPGSPWFVRVRLRLRPPREPRRRRDFGGPPIGSSLLLVVGSLSRLGGRGGLPAGARPARARPLPGGRTWIGSLLMTHAPGRAASTSRRAGAGAAPRARRRSIAIDEFA